MMESARSTALEMVPIALQVCSWVKHRAGNVAEHFPCQLYVCNKKDVLKKETFSSDVQLYYSDTHRPESTVHRPQSSNYIPTSASSCCCECDGMIVHVSLRSRCFECRRMRISVFHFVSLIG